jgi:hypothetical protein
MNPPQTELDRLHTEALTEEYLRAEAAFDQGREDRLTGRADRARFSTHPRRYRAGWNTAARFKPGRPKSGPFRVWVD